MRKLYSNPVRSAEAVLRVIHVQDADWATKFLLHKFAINAQNDVVGTDFGKYVKYKRPERRGGTAFMSGKSWKTTQDPWRGISRTSFGLDYLKHYLCPPPALRRGDAKDKMMELNYYDENDNPKYGYDVFIHRLSCYIQYKEYMVSLLALHIIIDALTLREFRFSTGVLHLFREMCFFDIRNAVMTCFRNSISDS